MNTLTERIGHILNSTKPNTRQRRKLLSQIKWRLRYGLLYAGLSERMLEGCILVSVDDPRCQIFDGRDNEDAKAKFYGALLNCKFEVELCECRRTEVEAG